MTPNGLEQYHELFEDEENLQNKWEAAVVHPKLGVDLLIGQLGDDDIRAIDDEENYYDTGDYDEMKKNYFLAYHQVEAHRRFLEENPDEVVYFRRFQLWYRQQTGGGHVPGHTPGDDRFWASESVGGNELG